MTISEIVPSAECRFAGDGIEALEKLADTSFSPSCIFMDLNMPRMNGKECLAEIGKIERLTRVPVIIYSTSIDNGLMEECRKLGATDFIVKPPGLQALTERLKKIIHDNHLYE